MAIENGEESVVARDEEISAVVAEFNGDSNALAREVVLMRKIAKNAVDSIDGVTTYALEKLPPAALFSACDAAVRFVLFVKRHSG